jgi:hypothetical protein
VGDRSSELEARNWELEGGITGARAAVSGEPQKIRVFSVFRGSDGKGEAQTARRTRIETAKNLKRAISA